MSGISNEERKRRMRKKVGRKTVFTPEVVGKLEEAAAMGCSLTEMALFAGINRDTLYSKLQDDKKFSQRIEELRESPMLKARKTIVASLETTDGAQWYAERKGKNEFSTRQEISADLNLKVEKLEAIQTATKDILK